MIEYFKVECLIEINNLLIKFENVNFMYLNINENNDLIFNEMI